MNLEFSETDLEFRKEVREFLATRLPDDIRERFQRGLLIAKADQNRWHRILNEKGWMAPSWPEEHGGTGWSLTQRYIWAREAAFAGAPPPTPFGVNMIGPILIAYGSDEQKAHYLPRILSGKDWWCQGYSEPDAGSDLASLQTRAVRKGKFFIVNGCKIWTTGAHEADMMFCLVRSNARVKKKQRGISLLLIDMLSTGIEVRPIVGLDQEHTLNEVSLNDVKVPSGNVVGEKDKGWTYAKVLLEHERVFIARVAHSQALVQRLYAIAGRERSGGAPLLSDPDFRRKLTALEVDLKALEYTELRYLALQMSDDSNAQHASLLKLEGSRIQQGLRALLVEALGTAAMPMEADAKKASSDYLTMGPDYMHGILSQHFYGRSASIAGGTSEVQKNVIARQLMDS
ncbi:MAG: acyl-CoA dehydrogenase family protein [Pseudomonadota bacterium]